MAVKLTPQTKVYLSGDANLSVDDLDQLGADLQAGRINRQEFLADARTLARSFPDLFGAGAGQKLVNMAGDLGERISVAVPVSTLVETGSATGPTAARVLRGELTLQRGVQSDARVVALFQRALAAIGSRTGHPEYALIETGATGVFGELTEAAVKAFQANHGLPDSGRIDQDTAMRIELELMTHPTPDLGGVVGVSTRKTGQAVVDAARELIAARAEDYGVEGVWRSPNPNIPGNARPEVTTLGTKGRWKCNIFGLDSLFKAGFKTPAYGSKDVNNDGVKEGWYPIAVEIPRYSTGEAPHFLKLGELKLEGLAPDEKTARIEKLLQLARPGDFIIVNHPGSETADGGHTRIVTQPWAITPDDVSAEDKALGARPGQLQIRCAQASSDAAKDKFQNLGDFADEEIFYLLRPNQVR